MILNAASSCFKFSRAPLNILQCNTANWKPNDTQYIFLNIKYSLFYSIMLIWPEKFPTMTKLGRNPSFQCLQANAKKSYDYSRRAGQLSGQKRGRSSATWNGIPSGSGRINQKISHLMLHAPSKTKTQITFVIGNAYGKEGANTGWKDKILM